MGLTDTPSFGSGEISPCVPLVRFPGHRVNQTHAAERQAAPGYTMDRLLSERGNFAEFSKTPVPRQNMLSENNEIVRFP